MKEIIKNIILENQFTTLPEVVRRKIEIPVDIEKIISIIGVRRSGKTFLLFQIIKDLIAKGIKKEQIVFLNFEDERLNLRRDNLDFILQAYQELYPDVEFSDVYLFFDEIQNIDGWEKFTRRVFDTRTKRIFITGSNSKLLSKEIATELRGRTISFSVFPLSFEEYLKFNDVKTTLNTSKERSKVLFFQKKYLEQGGFPETVFVNDRIRLKVLQEYFDVMIFRDIVERYNVSNLSILKFFIKKIFAGVTKPFSVNKAYNDLKSLGYKISNMYLYAYLDYCESIFLSFPVYKFHYSEIKQEKSDKKEYLIDNGLLSNIEFSVSQNKGKLLENAVCMEFVKSDNTIFYFKDRHECDFIVKKNKTFEPVQVTYSLENEETKKRELQGLYEACKFFNKKHGTIITFDSQEKLKYKDIDVNIIPFYKYFL